MNISESPLGLGGYIDRDTVESLTVSLTTIWTSVMGATPGPLGSDLALLRRWFDPVAQGQRLRRDLPTVATLPEEIDDPGAPFTFQVSPTQSLVTPEGRCVLDLISELPVERPGYMLADIDLAPYERRLAHVYREWSRHRINSVVELLMGEEKPLQISAAGVVLALLVNRSTSPDRALRRFPAGAARDVIDSAFFKAVMAFAHSLSPSQRATRDPRLISGWMLYEARRRLGDTVLIIEGSRPDSEGRLWIAEPRQSTALDVVARDLRRGHRARVTVDRLAHAFDSLVIAFRAELPRLAGFGVAHERPANTERIREELLKRFQQSAEDQ